MYSKWLWVLAVLPLVTGWRWPGQARPSKPAEPTAEEQTLHQMRQDLGAVVKREPPRPIRMLLVPGGRVANCSATWGVAMGRLASDVAKVILLYPPSALGNQPGQQILLPDCQEIPTLAGKIAVEQTLKTRLMRESGQFQSITLSAQQLSCVSEPVAMLSLMLRPVQVLPMFLTNDTQLANLTAILTEILQDHQTVLLAFLDADDPRACSPQWTEQVLHSDIKQLPCSIQTMDALMPRLGLEVFPVSLAQMRLPENARQAVAESLLFIESA